MRWVPGLKSTIFLFGWVGAVPHPMTGVPLTFLSAFHTEIHGKSLLLSNANANENATANAKVSRHLFRQQYEGNSSRIIPDGSRKNRLR